MNSPELKSILYVDDEPHIRELVQLCVELDSALTIRCVGSGETALEEIARAQPDLLLLDFMLPGMDGPSILKAVRSRPEWAGIHIVFMTARSMPVEIARLMDLGAIGVIPKPFDPLKLASHLHRLWENARPAAVRPADSGIFAGS